MKNNSINLFCFIKLFRLRIMFLTLYHTKLASTAQQSDKRRIIYK